VKLASRLSALYAALLGVTVLIIIVASSIALVLELHSFSSDIIIAKHEEARIVVDQLLREGMTLQQAAPEIARSLSGIGLRVAVYDSKGRFIAGDKTLRPHTLDRIIAMGGMRHFLPPTLHRSPYGPLAGMPLFGPPLPETRDEPLSVTAVDGGYVAFNASLPLVFVSLIPYWRIMLAIVVAAMLLSWLVGRAFAAQLLRPINEVADSLRTLASGDYTQRRFVMAGGDEVATLTAAYNDAAASVALAMEERRRAEERMRQFAADASHELRTPLTVIGGYIDVLRRGAIEEKTIARQILATMSLEKEHMRGLIDRLMRLARLDAETPPRPEAIDVTEFLRGQCDAVRRLDDHRVIDYSVEGVRSIEADRSELGEALWNIIENALKYAPEAPIHLRAVQTNGHPVITVRDEGPGMSESERLHAFERFYRGDQRGEIAGSGLGLAIAKRAVERAGGDIAIDSAPGHGTSVTITLPTATQSGTMHDGGR
jgi:two-component system, OmpR family, sensor kinase